MPSNTTSTDGGHPSFDRPQFSGILLASLSFVTLALISPILLWHFQNRNLGATALVSWLMVLLLFNFVNALLWPSDDFSTWYNGVGLCDVEVKIQIASEVGVPASFACILSALAAALDTEKSTLIQTKAQRQRRYAVDLLYCLGFPLLQMFFHYVVQPSRYYIFGITGCMPSVSGSWLTVLLMLVPPAIWVALNTYYAILILIRLCRYRLTFSSILASSQTSKSRFMRLYLICILALFVAIPLEVYIFYKNSLQKWHAYSWAETHSAAAWAELIYINSDGKILFTRWIPVGLGLAVFVFFGLGREAFGMYRSYLVVLGLNKCIPGSGLTGRGVVGGMMSSIGSKTKIIFKHKEVTSTSTWSGSDATSPTRYSPDLFSSKNEAFATTKADDGGV